MGTYRHTRTKRLDNRVDVLGLDAVDDIVAAPRDEVTASQNFNFRLVYTQHSSIDNDT